MVDPNIVESVSFSFVTFVSSLFFQGRKLSLKFCGSVRVSVPFQCFGQTKNNTWNHSETVLIVFMFCCQIFSFLKSSFTNFKKILEIRSKKQFGKVIPIYHFLQYKLLPVKLKPLTERSRNASCGWCVCTMAHTYNHKEHAYSS